LMGRMYEIPEQLFFRRDHPGAYTRKYYSTSIIRDYRKQLEWWTGNKNKNLLVLPYWKNFFEYINSVNRVHLTWKERFLCYREIARWLLKEKGLKRMEGDFKNEFQIWRIKLRYGYEGLAKNTYHL